MGRLPNPMNTARLSLLTLSLLLLPGCAGIYELVEEIIFEQTGSAPALQNPNLCRSETVGSGRSFPSSLTSEPTEDQVLAEARRRLEHYRSLRAEERAPASRRSLSANAPSHPAAPVSPGGGGQAAPEASTPGKSTDLGGM